ncbi:Hypothetical protein, putative [Bodo saltans]|uniref:Uncharacterized protein n=1 Tax=Bodo saltans TaxID=75058 RepID=A0A0S4JRA9_BODSA|nr:Hypothetical protein, putative [Bodo saltans]|eukprot:CUG92733.1 Hypothetical protein, putative [Bodo saltans]
MFRRNVRRLVNVNGDKDRERIHRERQRNMMYDRNGRVRWTGAAQLFYEEFKFPVQCIVGGLAFTYFYQKLIIYMCRRETAGAVALDRKSEEIARESGKLKSDRFLVKPRRQIDDPDMRDLPTHSGKSNFKSRLLYDDTYSAGTHHEEFSRHK